MRNLHIQSRLPLLFCKCTDLICPGRLIFLPLVCLFGCCGLLIHFQNHWHSQQPCCQHVQSHCLEQQLSKHCVMPNAVDDWRFMHWPWAYSSTCHRVACACMHYRRTRVHVCVHHVRVSVFVYAWKFALMNIGRSCSLNGRCPPWPHHPYCLVTDSQLSSLTFDGKPKSVYRCAH